MTILTRDLVDHAFDALGHEAAQRGIVAEIAVYGGSCIMLASDIRDATGDVDAVFLTDQNFLYEAARRVGPQLSLPEDWLNQAVKRVAPPVGGAEPNLIAFGDYPRRASAAVELRVFPPTPAYRLGKISIGILIPCERKHCFASFSIGQTEIAAFFASIGSTSSAIGTEVPLNSAQEKRPKPLGNRPSTRCVRIGRAGRMPRRTRRRSGPARFRPPTVLSSGRASASRVPVPLRSGTRTSLGTPARPVLLSR